jgi:hypothetical protein
MRKTFLLGGVILLIASGSWAGARTRGGDSLRGGGSDAMTPQVREIAPGVAERTVNGVTTRIEANNVVDLERDVIGVFGSVQNWMATMSTIGMDSMPGPDGPVFASNTSFYLEGYVDSALLPVSIERLKQTQTHMTTTVNGAEVTMFANGVVGLETDLRGPMQSMPAVLSVMVLGKELRADGAVVAE